MNPVSWLITGGLIFAVGGALAYCFAARRRGGCSGSCGSCPYGGSCRAPRANEKKNKK